ncbi:MAG: hypothetical protein COU06_00780 [Candidatus Harrisonbacteria bacterium CG10_big_fil_rev_8_21_14_0_10_38_8]|uniref:AI-2E family transporter n=1 Tax=Candidatus Harrisonbacteria bacterium CG10_big_fil_rev_8_21_14_0_10_38_8 TaxID=1974582 RepID=A0A2M6WKH5_9BACT|nr:MAG: hypothetical protein COU06_00780 [Candidatus Harrisonbacteria bacterium CG10_big_fil_rev_8_21_14_0_10_38_8]
MNSSRSVQLSFFFTVFAIFLVLGFFIFKPYLNIMVLAGTFAVIFHPLFKKIDKGMKNKLPSIASFIVVLLATLIVFVPLGFLGVRVFQEASSLYETVNNRAQSEMGPLGDILPSGNVFVEEFRLRFEQSVTLNIGSYAERFLNWIIENAVAFSQSFAQFLLAVFLWFLSFYYFLRDGDRIREIFIGLSPLSDKYDIEIVKRVGIAIKSVVGGSLIVAVIQGVSAGVGFAIFGIPAPFMWGMFAILAALVPTIGTGILMIPALGYLLLTGDYVSAIGLGVWGLLIVGPIDNILRPKLIERQIKIHPLLILLSVLGGISLFGPIGFLTGPIILSLIFEFLKIYQEMVVEERKA